MYNLRMLIHNKMIVLALVHLIVFHTTGYNSDYVLLEGGSRCTALKFLEVAFEIIQYP